jgi:iron complex transport system substrate-binding protein
MVKIAVTILASIALLCYIPAALAETKLFALVDDQELDITPSKLPDRIVSLSPSNTEILFALGLDEKLVGVTKYCNYPPEIDHLKERGKVAIVGGFVDPDIEKILYLCPDLILANGAHISVPQKELEEMGITTFIIKPNNLSNIISSIEEVGKITGKQGEASLLTGKIESRIRAVSDRVDGMKKKRVLFILWNDPVMVAGSGTLEDEIIEKMGGSNIFHDLSGYSQADPEAILARNPEVIITCKGMANGDDKLFLWAKTDSILSQTEARNDNQIYQAEGDIITRAGPRIIDGLEMFASFIHPEAS